MLLGRKQLLINGEWRDASNGKTQPVANPATEEVIAEVASATDEDVDAAVSAARAALDGPWGKMPARERGRLVYKLGEQLMAQADEVARLETLHNGKPITESRHVEIPAAAECLQYFAGWADKVHGETVPVKGGQFVYTLREPVGVVAAIVPWNFPLLIAVWKVAPALAMGNTVILKPASQTPLTAIALGEMATALGFPPGVLNVITGSGATAGQAIVNHPGIDKIAFTGDTSTGKGIMRSAADSLKHITLELGGKSPNIVFADADIDAAVRGATMGIFYGKGEVCAAGSFAGGSVNQGRSPCEGDRSHEENGGWRSDESEDTIWRHLVEGPTRPRVEVRGDGEKGRRDAPGGRRAHGHRHRQGLLHAAKIHLQKLNQS
jgi:aldehyde dehydrogenase (NAD+)